MNDKINNLLSILETLPDIPKRKPGKYTEPGSNHLEFSLGKDSTRAIGHTDLSKKLCAKFDVRLPSSTVNFDFKHYGKGRGFWSTGFSANESLGIKDNLHIKYGEGSWNEEYTNAVNGYLNYASSTLEGGIALGRFRRLELSAGILVGRGNGRVSTSRKIKNDINRQVRNEIEDSVPEDVSSDTPNEDSNYSQDALDHVPEKYHSVIEDAKISSGSFNRRGNFPVAKGYVGSTFYLTNMVGVKVRAMIPTPIVNGGTRALIFGGSVAITLNASFNP